MPDSGVVSEGDTYEKSETSGKSMDQARAMYEGAYNGDTFTTDTTDEAFAYRYTSTGNADMTLRSSMFLGTIEGSIQPQDEYVVAWLTGGEGAMDLGPDEVAFDLGKPRVFPTGKRFTFEFSDYRQNLVHFRAEFLEKVAAEHEGALPGPIHFEHSVTPDEDALARWKQTITSVAKTVLGSEPAPLLQAEVNRLAAVAMLDTFAHRTTGFDPVLLAPRNARLREAVEYIHANARLPISAADVAKAVDLSPRGLQQAFSRQLDTTPTEYIRAARLEHVYTELLNLDPDVNTVAEVARRWGFTHLSRFAGAYAEKYGEHPSDTLRR